MEFSGGPPPSRLWLIFFVLPIPALLIGGYVLTASPRLEYRVEADEVVIDAALGRWPQGRTIPKSSITSAELLDAGRASRTAGTGLPGYCNGRFDVDGRAVWAATDCGRALVRVETTDGPIVVSPADRAGFIAAATTPGQTGEFPPRPSEGPSSQLPLMFFAIFLLPMLALPILAARIWRPIVYRIEQGELVVPRHFGDVRAKLEGARFRRGDPGRMFRVAGSGLPGFHLGKYRAFGRGVHMAATRREDLVLIESGERAVVVSPAEMTPFLDALREAGARDQA